MYRPSYQVAYANFVDQHHIMPATPNTIQPVLLTSTAESSGDADPQYQKAPRTRTTFSFLQQSGLESEFQNSEYLYKSRRIEIAERLGLEEKHVKVWFQNRRMKKKKEILSNGNKITKSYKESSIPVLKTTQNISTIRYVQGHKAKAEAAKLPVHKPITAQVVKGISLNPTKMPKTFNPQLIVQISNGTAPSQQQVPTPIVPQMKQEQPVEIIVLQKPNAPNQFEVITNFNIPTTQVSQQLKKSEVQNVPPTPNQVSQQLMKSEVQNVSQMTNQMSHQLKKSEVLNVSNQQQYKQRLHTAQQQLHQKMHMQSQLQQTHQVEQVPAHNFQRQPLVTVTNVQHLNHIYQFQNQAQPQTQQNVQLQSQLQPQNQVEFQAQQQAQHAPLPINIVPDWRQNLDFDIDDLQSIGTEFIPKSESEEEEESVDLDAYLIDLEQRLDARRSSNEESQEHTTTKKSNEVLNVPEAYSIDFSQMLDSPKSVKQELDYPTLKMEGDDFDLSNLIGNLNTYFDPSDKEDIFNVAFNAIQNDDMFKTPINGKQDDIFQMNLNLGHNETLKTPTSPEENDIFNTSSIVFPHDDIFNNTLSIPELDVNARYPGIEDYEYDMKDIMEHLDNYVVYPGYSTSPSTNKIDPLISSNSAFMPNFLSN